LVYLEGLSEVRSKTRARGLAAGAPGVGLGLGVAKTVGHQQSLLSKATAPPKQHMTLTMILAIIIALFGLGTFGSSHPLINISIVALAGIGVCWVLPLEQGKYDAAMALYSATRMCQRCGQLYRDNSQFEAELELCHRKRDLNSGKFGLLALLIVVLAIAVAVLDHKPQIGSGNQATVQPAPIAGNAVPAENTLTDRLSRYHLYKARIGEATYLRSLFNDYLAGSADHSGGGDRSNEFALLNKWDSSYYRSKFFVILVEKAPMGGSLISILFRDKPDKVLVAWVYDLAGGGYELRGLDSASLTKEEVDKVIRSLVGHAP
jgi:hypothetical protein